MPKNRDGSKDKEIRPTSDRARETLFDVLNNNIEFDNLSCLDLFAGTGALGFEALSRGAGFCRFVDTSVSSLNSIKKTGDVLGCRERIELVKDKAISYLEKAGSEYYDIIFADPPYSYKDYEILARAALRLKPQIFVLEISSRGDTVSVYDGYNLSEKKSGSAKFLLYIQN